MLKLGSLFDGAGGFPFAAVMCGIEPVWASEIEPFPIAVTTKRFPNMKHLGDVSKINGAEIEPVDIITFGSPCFPAGTLVLTSKGNIPIERVAVGDRVLTHTGKWQTVTATGHKSDQTVILKGNHFGLECTPNHPIYTAPTNKVYTASGKRVNRAQLSDERLWVRADEMQGLKWATPRKVEGLPIDIPVPADGKTKAMPEQNEDFWYLVGRYVGDGWVRDTQRNDRPDGERFATIFICDGLDKEQELVDAVAKVVERYSTEHNDSSVKVKFNSRLFCDWLTENFGKGAENKHLPAWAYGMPLKYRTALLRGVADTDGFKVKGTVDETWSIATISRTLAHDLRTLAECCGCRSRVYRTAQSTEKVIQGRTVKQAPYFYNTVFSKAKDAKRQHLCDDLHSWYTVREEYPTHLTKTVYNLTVENDNSYIADSIVVHNCQDLSVAGKRAGLEGERSGLFMQAIRIIEEMRSATNGSYLRIAVWENVPGAFSSAKGEDFRAVLEAFCQVVNENADVPRPANGKWSYAGEIVGDGYSVAWRVLDAQYWGVPQRRRRIFLVADFRGGRAGEILFEREGLSRNFAESRASWQGITKSLAFRADAEGRATYCLQANGIDRADTAGCNGCGWSDKGVSYTLNTIDRHAVCYGIDQQGGKGNANHTEDAAPTLLSDSHGTPHAVCAFACNQRDEVRDLADKAGALQAEPGMKQQTFLAVYDARGNGDGQVAPTITGDHENRITDYTAVLIACNWDGGQTVPTLTARNAGGSQRMPDKDNFQAVLCVRERCGCEGGGKGCLVQKNVAGALACHNDQFLCYPIFAFQAAGDRDNPTISVSDKAFCIPANAMSDRGQAVLCVALDRAAYNQGQNAQFDPGIDDSGKAFTVIAKGPGAVCYALDAAICTVGNSTAQGKCWYADISPTLKAGGVHATAFLTPVEIILRRLTPTECARLQGMPDWWCDDVPHSDSAEYKMWGNGMALPCVLYVMEGVAECLRKEPPNASD